MIRAATSADAGQIASVYNHYVTQTVISFEEEPLTASAMRDRINAIQRTHAWFVAEDQGVVQGFAYAAPWHARPAYRHTAETTVYIDNAHHGRGVGTSLYEVLLDDLRKRGVHAALGVIALPNPGSVALHERFGFEQVGMLKAVGRKFDRWVDVGFWQLML